MGKNKTPEPDLHEILSEALDEQLPEGAVERCIKRVVRETGPIRLLQRPPRPPADAPQIAYPSPTDDADI